MQDGLFTIVIRISGSKDPMNDDAATMEIGYSPDRITKDARGGMAADFPTGCQDRANIPG